MHCSDQMWRSDVAIRSPGWGMPTAQQSRSLKRPPLLPPPSPTPATDEVAAFTDGSAAWFNAARDLPPPVPPAADADPLERAEHELRMHEYDAERWRPWLAVACHLVAHCFCGPHGDRFGEALEEVQAHFRGVAAA